jgi:hypothetical protein
VDIDRTAGATAEGEIQIEAPIDTVWAVLSGLSAWPTLEPRRQVDGRRWTSGAGFGLPVEVRVGIAPLDAGERRPIP